MSNGHALTREEVLKEIHKLTDLLPEGFIDDQTHPVYLAIQAMVRFCITNYSDTITTETRARNLEHYADQIGNLYKQFNKLKFRADQWERSELVDNSGD